jgi:hypothetical protein
MSKMLGSSGQVSFGKNKKGYLHSSKNLQQDKATCKVFTGLKERDLLPRGLPNLKQPHRMTNRGNKTTCSNRDRENQNQILSGPRKEKIAGH